MVIFPRQQLLRIAAAQMRENMAEKSRLILYGQNRQWLRLPSMLYTIAVILLILWLAGWLGFNMLGGFIHILVVLAVVALVMALLKKA